MTMRRIRLAWIWLLLTFRLAFSLNDPDDPRVFLHYIVGRVAYPFSALRRRHKFGK